MNVVIVFDEDHVVEAVVGMFFSEEDAEEWIERASKTVWCEKPHTHFHITQMTEPTDITGE